MKISYLGKSERSNYRMLTIDYKPKEERFIGLLHKVLVNCYCEKINISYFADCDEEIWVGIIVDCKEEFDYLKDFIHRLKKINWKSHYSKHIKKLRLCDDFDFVYSECASDFEMFAYLWERGCLIKDVEKIMCEVSGTNDAFNNALNAIYVEVCKIGLVK